MDLAESVKDSVSAVELAVVTEAGPTEAAKKRGVKIPGNCVIGVFNNDFAVRILSLSKAAMIEAPMRMYVTENDDGSAISRVGISLLLFLGLGLEILVNEY